MEETGKTMAISDGLTTTDLAIRAHDITVCLERTTVPEFDFISLLGMAARLAMHLRGVQAVSYTTIRDVAVYLLDFPSSTVVKPVLELLAEAEFVKLDTEGNTIKTIIPDIPFYENLFTSLGNCANNLNKISEPEYLTLSLMKRLSASPMLVDHVYQTGAEKKLVDRVIDIGSKGNFLINRRARGRSVLLSPTYFPENVNAYTDLVAANGAGRVKKVLELLKLNQGWPLVKIESERMIGQTPIEEADILVTRMLAGEGFLPPPAIETTHAGANSFLFGPRPGKAYLPPEKRQVYEAAMALVAAVRQGQLLPAKYAIRSPIALLSAFRDKGYLQANTEAIEQYRQVAALRVGRIEKLENNWGKLYLVDLPENREAVDMAISMVSGAEPQVNAREDIILSLRQGEKYVESLIGRKRILENKPIEIDEESQDAIDSFLLRGRE